MRLLSLPIFEGFSNFAVGDLKSSHYGLLVR